MITTSITISFVNALKILVENFAQCNPEDSFQLTTENEPSFCLNIAKCSVQYEHLLDRDEERH